METVVAEQHISMPLESKIPPETKYIIKREDHVRVYREQIKRREVPFPVLRTTQKIISVTDGRNVEKFNICSLLPITPETNDADLN